MRMYRSAKHPDFVAHVIEPRLVESERPVTWAEAVAGLMDTGMYGLDDAIAACELLVFGVSEETTSEETQ